MKSVVAVTVTVVISVSAFCFIKWSVDFSEWSQNDRVGLATLGAIKINSDD